MQETKKVSIQDVMEEKDQQQKAEKYNQYIKQVTPRHNCMKNVAKAFLIGGIICLIGQCFQEWYGSMGANKEDAGLQHLRLIIRCRDRYLELDAIFFLLRGRLYYMELLVAGYWELFIGYLPVLHKN